MKEKMENGGVMAWEYLEGAGRGSVAEKQAAWKTIKRYAKDKAELEYFVAMLLDFE